MRLRAEGFVEDVRPSRRASHILAHQLMGLAVQSGGIARGDFWAWLDGATAFDGLTSDERDAIVDHMIGAEILSSDAGKLWLGPVGEKTYGRANFRELYAVFEVPRLITVRAGTEEIGTVDAKFLATLDSDKEPASFTLAGRAWQIITIDWSRGRCVVRPCPAGRPPRWAGSARHLGYKLCQAMRSILVDEAVDPAWSPRAQTVIVTLRAEHEFLRDAISPLMENRDEITWWNYAGGGANVLLARVLEAELGGACVSRNISITLKGDAGKSLVRVKQVLAAMKAAGRPTAEEARTHAAGAVRSRVSKFQPCLPEPLLQDLLVESVLDVDGARAAVGAVA